MRLGMSGCFLPEDMREFTADTCARVREHGFSGVFTRFRRNDPLTTPRHDAERLRDLLAGEGLRLFQVTGYWQNMVTTDEGRRSDAVKTIRAALRLAGWMGARGIDTGPGSMNPAGPWFPHPDNYAPQARRQLVRTLKECAAAAEDAQVLLSLESHQLVTLRSPEITRAVLDEVASPWVTADYDSANWITLETVFETGRAIDHHFNVLGHHIASCHAKDIWPENRLAVHLQDGCPGRGTMDFHSLFRRMEALSPDLPVIAEGNNTAELPEVAALFHRVAADLGIAILEAEDAA